MLVGGEAFERALADFYERWKSEPLVIDKWFALQAQDPSEGALGRVLGLTAHPDFDPANPNRLRALVATFVEANPHRFHDPSGAGYRFLADQVLMADGFNPKLAAGLVEPLGQWARYTPELGALMRAELERVTKSHGLSKNVFEIATKSLA
jgi:aminopeptidase N